MRGRRYTDVARDGLPDGALDIRRGLPRPALCVGLQRAAVRFKVSGLWGRRVVALTYEG